MQPAHALAEFAFTYPETFKKWHQYGKNLVVLSTTNEKQLKKLAAKFQEQHIAHVLFCEPDIGNKATAIALEPNEETNKLTQYLPLTLKNHAEEGKAGRPVKSVEG